MTLKAPLDAFANTPGVCAMEPISRNVLRARWHLHADTVIELHGQRPQDIIRDIICRYLLSRRGEESADAETVWSDWRKYLDGYEDPARDAMVVPVLSADKPLRRHQRVDGKPVAKTGGERIEKMRDELQVDEARLRGEVAARGIRVDGEPVGRNTQRLRAEIARLESALVTGALVTREPVHPRYKQPESNDPGRHNPRSDAPRVSSEREKSPPSSPSGGSRRTPPEERRSEERDSDASAHKEAVATTVVATNVAATPVTAPGTAAPVSVNSGAPHAPAAPALELDAPIVGLLDADLADAAIAILVSHGAPAIVATDAMFDADDRKQLALGMRAHGIELAHLRTLCRVGRTHGIQALWKWKYDEGNRSIDGLFLLAKRGRCHQLAHGVRRALALEAEGLVGGTNDVDAAREMPVAAGPGVARADLDPAALAGLSDEALVPYVARWKDELRVAALADAHPAHPAPPAVREWQRRVRLRETG